MRRRFSRLSLLGFFGGRGSHRLIRSYFLVSLFLVGGGLITSGLLEIYFLYFDNREQISQFQGEVAAGVAFKIEQFVQEIEKTMRGATKSREVVLKGISPEYEFELQKLLLLAPPITETVAMGESGVARTQVSRLRTILPGNRRNLLSTESFQQVIQGKSYFSPVYFSLTIIVIINTFN